MKKNENKIKSKSAEKIMKPSTKSLHFQTDRQNFFLWGGGVFKVRGRFLSNFKTLIYPFSIYLPYIKLKGKILGRYFTNPSKTN